MKFCQNIVRGVYFRWWKSERKHIPKNVLEVSKTNICDLRFGCKAQLWLTITLMPSQKILRPCSSLKKSPKFTDLLCSHLESNKNHTNCYQARTGLCDLRFGWKTQYCATITLIPSEKILMPCSSLKKSPKFTDLLFSHLGSNRTLTLINPSTFKQELAYATSYLDIMHNIAPRSPSYLQKKS